MKKIVLGFGVAQFSALSSVFAGLSAGVESIPAPSVDDFFKPEPCPIKGADRRAAIPPRVISATKQDVRVKPCRANYSRSHLPRG